MYYLYILYSTKANRYYVGITEDYQRRLDQHNNNRIEKYTGKYKDWELKSVYTIGEDLGKAMEIEKYIKRQKSRKLLDILISGKKELTGMLSSMVRVPYVRD
jgi:putative endonuclease